MADVYVNLTFERRTGVQPAVLLITVTVGEFQIPTFTALLE
jgi:hypothetical protein